MPLIDLTPTLNDTVLEHIGQDVLIGSDTVRGIFYKRYREIETTDGALVGLEISLDCKFENAVQGLARGDVVVIDGQNYRFERFVPDGGDESGWVSLELGTIGT